MTDRPVIEMVLLPNVPPFDILHQRGIPDTQNITRGSPLRCVIGNGFFFFFLTT
jgi:hypothetical protein